KSEILPGDIPAIIAKRNQLMSWMLQHEVARRHRRDCINPEWQVRADRVLERFNRLPDQDNGPVIENAFPEYLNLDIVLFNSIDWKEIIEKTDSRWLSGFLVNEEEAYLAMYMFRVSRRR